MRTRLPTVAIVARSPAAPDPWELRTDALELAHAATTPLQATVLTCGGRVSLIRTPRHLLRGEPGTPVEMTMDLGVGHRRDAIQVSAGDAIRDPMHRLGDREHPR